MFLKMTNVGIIRGVIWVKGICNSAAYFGHIDILKWVRSPELGENKCPWDNEVIRYARWNNHYELEKWALENGCPNNIDTYHDNLFRELCYMMI